MKFFQVSNEPARIADVQRRMTKVKKDALSLGYPRLVDKNGKISGIAKQMPPITELIRTTLDRESEYRLLSGVVHGHHWAVHQMGFKVIEVPDPGGDFEKALEKHVHPEVVLFGASIAVTSFSKLNWNLWQLFGWNLQELEDLFSATFDKLGYSKSLRFWK